MHFHFHRPSLTHPNQGSILNSFAVGNPLPLVSAHASWSDWTTRRIGIDTGLNPGASNPNNDPFVRAQQQQQQQTINDANAAAAARGSVQNHPDEPVINEGLAPGFSSLRMNSPNYRVYGSLGGSPGQLPMVVPTLGPTGQPVPNGLTGNYGLPQRMTGSGLQLPT